MSKVSNYYAGVFENACNAEKGFKATNYDWKQKDAFDDLILAFYGLLKALHIEEEFEDFKREYYE